MLRLRSVFSHPDRLVDTQDGVQLEQANGLLNTWKLARIQTSQSPLRVSPRSSHPNRIVWKWVEIGPVRVLHGQMSFVCSFLWRRLAV